MIKRVVRSVVLLFLFIILAVFVYSFGVDVTAPTDNSTINGTAFQVIANVSPPGENITNMSVFVNGTFVCGNLTFNLTEYGCTFDTTAFADGIYDITINLTNVTAVGTNASNVSVITNVTIDNNPPSVANLAPANNTTFNQTDIFNISVNVSENITDRVDTVIANITYPNGTFEQLFLLEQGDTQVFNNTFNSTTQPGVYEIRIQANDTVVGNLNNTEFVNIHVLDNRTPLVIIFAPANNTTYNQSDVFNISVNVTDFFNV